MHKRIILTLSIVLMSSCSSLLSINEHRAAFSAFQNGLFAVDMHGGTLNYLGDVERIPHDVLHKAYEEQKLVCHLSSLYKVIINEKASDKHIVYSPIKIGHAYYKEHEIPHDLYSVEGNVVVVDNKPTLVYMDPNEPVNNITAPLTHPGYTIGTILGIATTSAVITALATHVYNKKYQTEYSKAKLAACAWFLTAAGTTFYYYY